MDNLNMFETIYTRKSIRNFLQDKLEWDVLDDILQYIMNLPTFIEGISTEILLVNNIEEKQGFRGPFSIKAPYYICISSEDKEGYQLNAGYLMQHISLYIESKGLGTCYMGGAKPNKSLRSQMKDKYVITLAFGKSTEILHRDSSEADRLPENQLVVYKEDVSTDIKQIITTARLAPSSFNSQPWRFVVYKNRIHIFTKKYPPFARPLNNIKMINMGIMLANMLLAAEALWINVELKEIETIKEQSFKNNEYVISLLY